MQAAEAMGVRTANGKRVEQVASFTLGTATVSPLTMAEAYATLAAERRPLRLASDPLDDHA